MKVRMMQKLMSMWNQFWAIDALGRLARSMESGQAMRPALVEIRRHSFGAVRRRIDAVLAELPERPIGDAISSPGMEWPRR